MCSLASSKLKSLQWWFSTGKTTNYFGLIISLPNHCNTQLRNMERTKHQHQASGFAGIYNTPSCWAIKTWNSRVVVFLNWSCLCKGGFTNTRWHHLSSYSGQKRIILIPMKYGPNTWYQVILEGLLLVGSFLPSQPNSKISRRTGWCAPTDPHTHLKW